jgi:L-methionine (R)-S-oxide reductase
MHPDSGRISSDKMEIRQVPKVLLPSVVDRVITPVMPKYEDLLREFQGLACSVSSPESLMQRMSQRVHAEMARYNWVGFYLLDRDDPNLLVLGPFTGSFTPIERIPLDRGLCGAAAATGRTVVVNNVAQDPRYLSASDIVKAELVAPVFAFKKLIGEIDVESYFAETFLEDDRTFVEACAAIVGRYFENLSPSSVSHPTAPESFQNKVRTP